MGSFNSGNLNASFPDYYLNYSHTIGGICGSSGPADVIACYNTGDINCEGRERNEVGGICGNFFSGDLYACYNSGTITGYYQGGICGYQYNIGKIYSGLWLEGKAPYLEGRGKASTGKVSDAELRLASEQLNKTIREWNEANLHIKCHFFFKSPENEKYPILVSQPKVNTLHVTGITNNSAMLYAEFELGDELVISQGFKYKKTKDPDFYQIEIFGEEISTMIICESSSEYVCQAYITTDQGTYTGEEFFFSTLPDMRIISLSGDLSFGEIEVGNSISRELTVKNDGNDELMISNIELPSGFQTE